MWDWLWDHLLIGYLLALGLTLAWLWIQAWRKEDALKSRSEPPDFQP